MKLPSGTGHVSFLCLLALGLALALSATRWRSSRHDVPAPGWGLAEFIDQLHARGIQFRAIPDRPDGSWCDAAFLTEAPATTS